MADLGRRNSVKLVICLAWLVGFVALLVHVTADDDHEEGMSVGNNTMENSSRICDFNCTNTKIEELQSEISRNFNILLVMGFTLATSIIICHSCWKGGKERFDQLDRTVEEMKKKMKKFKDEFDEMNDKLDNTPAVKTNIGKITTSLILSASPYQPDSHGNCRKPSLTDPEALSPPSPALYSTPPTSLVQCPGVANVCTVQEARQYQDN